MGSILLQVPCLLGTDCLPRPLPKRPRNCGKPVGVWTLKRLPEVCHAQGRIDTILACFVLHVSIRRRMVRRLPRGHWNAGVGVALLVGTTLDLSTIPPHNLRPPIDAYAVTTS